MNESLIAVDLSHNQLSGVGETIGKILSDHSQRRNEIVWMYGLRGEYPEEDLSRAGLC